MTDPLELIGHRLGQYEIREYIARGGMADVYLAEDTDLNRRVALKILLPALAHDEQFVARFRREARTVAQLDHPNIIQVYGIGLTPTQRPYIAMQYIEGGSLKDLLQRAAEQGQLLPTGQALAIIRQMAAALSVAHQADIIHRDIKPSNILIRPDGTPVLVDLGIAVVQSAPKLTQTGTLMGTPHYMSPEQARSLPLDERSDIYSLGIVLYELLSGRRPFEAAEPLAVLHKHVYEEAVPLRRYRSDLAPQTDEIVRICMQKEPERRFQTAAQLMLAVDQALRAEGVTEHISPSGGWLATPIGAKFINRADHLREPTTAAAPPSHRWRLYVLLPAILLLLGFAAFRLLPLTDIPPPTQVAGVVAADLPTAEPTVTAEPTAPPTSTAAPTLTPAPPPATLTATPTAMATETPDVGPERLEIGRSVQDRPIEAVRFGVGEQVVLFIGGLHAGFAPGTVTLAQQAIDHFTANPQDVPPGVTLYIIPSASPDSPVAPGELDGRLNANQVDLNRNWDCAWTQDARWRNNIVPGSGGPAAFSEPETRALRDFIQDIKPAAVVFWEAQAQGGLSSPGACGQRSLVSIPLAQTYGRAAGYRVADFENLTNQELNGDGTNWLDQQGIPAIAVLLPDYEGTDWPGNVLGMLAVLREAAQ